MAAVFFPHSLWLSLCYSVFGITFFKQEKKKKRSLSGSCESRLCSLRSRCSEADYGNNRNRVTGAGKVNLRRQRVGSAAEEIDFGVYCPAICHTKPLL